MNDHCWGDSLPTTFVNFKRTTAGFNPRFEHLNSKPNKDTNKLIAVEMRPMEKISLDAWKQMPIENRPDDPWNVVLPQYPINGYIDPLVTYIL